MVEIIWTQPTLSYLNDVAEYIALENVVTAKQLVQTVFTKVELLADFPESGRVSLELEHLNYREVVVNPCRVFYKYDDEKVRIVFVMSAERDLRRLMLTKQ